MLRCLRHGLLLRSSAARLDVAPMPPRGRRSARVRGPAPGGDARRRPACRASRGTASRLHVALAQQRGQVVDVAAEGRQLGARGDERGEVVGATRPARQHGHVGHQAGEVGAARQAGGTCCGSEPCGLLAVRRIDSLTRPRSCRAWPRRHQARRLPAPRSRATAARTSTETLTRSARARATSAAFRPRMSTVTKSGVGVFMSRRVEASEALVKLAARRLSLHSPMHSVLARIEVTGPMISSRRIIARPARHIEQESARPFANVVEAESAGASAHGLVPRGSPH